MDPDRLARLRRFVDGDGVALRYDVLALLTERETWAALFDRRADECQDARARGLRYAAQLLRGDARV
jgi:hypothetical protein